MDEQITDERTLLFYKPSTTYGSNKNGSATSLESGKRIIYCIHGKSQDSCVGKHTLHDNVIIEEKRVSSLEDEHCHNYQQSPVDKKARRKLIVASILCVIFMIGEAVGGYLSNSLAIATDAAHLLTDFASFMISLFSLWVASRPPTRGMSFGWYRAEVIGALTSVLMIWVVTGVLVYLAVERIVTKDFVIEAKIMLITSAVGVAVNLIMGVTLHQHGHSHGGGSSHSHGGGSSHSHGQENINVRAAFIHVIGDFIQSVGVFVAALIIYFKPTYLIVDPICTFIFSALVLLTTYAIVKDAITVLMEGKPKQVDTDKVLNTFLGIENVVKVHNLRIWSLTLDKIALSAHLAIRPGSNPQVILAQASKSIRKEFNFFEITLQIEEFKENMENCTQCQMPDK